MSGSESQAVRPSAARAVSAAVASDAADIAGRKGTTTSCGSGRSLQRRGAEHLVGAMTVLARFRAPLIEKLHCVFVAPCWYEHGEDDTAGVREPFRTGTDVGRKQ
ncbi:hypothetical protein TPA0906_65760 [Streptomyces olivaceus]|nr:hypothetical protein TPA0906_65760 [Streptomyces olivaceus]